jgi:hypothetical protein
MSAPLPVLRSSFLVLVALGAFGCGGDPPQPAPAAATTSGGGAAGEPTYWEQVKPILDARCSTCHVEGGPAPFVTTDYAAVLPMRDAIKAYVADRVMPPWLASDGCNDYYADRSLTDEQIELLVKWVDAGAPEGDPAREGAALDVAASGLSRADLTIGMPGEYTPQTAPDDYRCFVIDWPETTTRYVTGFRARPGNGAIVHHVIAFLASPSQVATAEGLDAAEPGPGYTCYGGPGFTPAWLGGWAPGNQGSDFPPDTGLPVEPGSKVVLQVHYNTLTAEPQPDQTSIELKLDDSVKTEAWVQPWTNWEWLDGTGMGIPAHSTDVTHEFTFDPTLVLTGGDAFTIYSVGLHMHTKGQSGRLEIQRQGGGSECLLDIPAWNFHWQGSYGLMKPTRFEPGDEMHLSCTWDNPTDEDVHWGEGTTDEMCLGTFYLTR